jgi:hypothetical protein
MTFIVHRISGSAKDRESLRGRKRVVVVSCCQVATNESVNTMLELSRRRGGR